MNGCFFFIKSEFDKINRPLADFHKLLREFLCQLFKIKKVLVFILNSIPSAVNSYLFYRNKDNFTFQTDISFVWFLNKRNKWSKWKYGSNHSQFCLTGIWWGFIGFDKWHSKTLAFFAFFEFFSLLRKANVSFSSFSVSSARRIYCITS